MANKVDTSKMTRKEREAYEAQQKFKKTIIIAVAVAVLFVGIVAAVYFAFMQPKPLKVENNGVAANTDYADLTVMYEQENDPIATMTMSDGSKIVMQLYPAAAPNTVANFVELANSGYYDGLTFHRVISSFMIQGGDPAGNGTGGPGYSIKGEFKDNGHDNNISHMRGVVSMARANDYDSAGSQFFIMHADNTYLDGSYAAFGKVIEGMDVVDAIASVATDDNDKPITDVVIESITVETYGVEYAVEKIAE